MPQTSFLRRLRERKLVGWTLAYVAGAWLLYQVVDDLSAPWDLAPVVLRVLQGLLLLGLPLTMVLAWYHGEKGRQRVSGPELVLIAGLLGIAALLARFLNPRSGEDPGRHSEVTATPVRSSLELRRRLAVLPLDNFTGDPEKQHVVQGLHEAITFSLGSLSALEVISRTSVLSYAGSELSAPEIGSELGVGSVLEGSVMAQGDSVRITLQLIDTGTDAHEWVGRYAGDLSDLMRLEDEISREVARELRAHLTPREDSLLATSPRVDPRAGENYLRARTAGRAEAVPLLEEAIRLDPDFAAPYGELARWYGEMAFSGVVGARAAADLYQRVVSLANRGLQLDSTLVSAYTALGEVAFHRDWDWEAAGALFDRAQEVNPSYSPTYMRISGHRTGLGDAEGAIEAARLAQAVDPRSPGPRGGLAGNLFLLRRYREAVEEADIALAMAPGRRGTLALRGRALVADGRIEEGLADLEAAGDTLQLAMGLADAGRMDEARRLREALIATPGAEEIPGYELASLLAQTGDPEAAIGLLEALERDRVGALVWLNVDPDLDAIRDDPRVRGILQRMSYPVR